MHKAALWTAEALSDGLLACFFLACNISQALPSCRASCTTMTMIGLLLLGALDQAQSPARVHPIVGDRNLICLEATQDVAPEIRSGLCPASGAHAACDPEPASEANNVSMPFMSFALFTKS